MQAHRMKLVASNRYSGRLNFNKVIQSKPSIAPCTDVCSIIGSIENSVIGPGIVTQQGDNADEQRKHRQNQLRRAWLLSATA